MKDNHTGKSLFSNLEEVWASKESSGNGGIECNEDDDNDTRKEGDADYWVKYYAHEQLKRDEINKVHRLAGELKRKNGSVTSVNMMIQQQQSFGGNQQRRQLVFSRPFKPDSQARVLRARDKLEELEKQQQQSEIGKQHNEKDQEKNERNQENLEGGEQVKGRQTAGMIDATKEVEKDSIQDINNGNKEKEENQRNHMKLIETTLNLQLPLNIDKANALNSKASAIENLYEKRKDFEQLQQKQQLQLVLDLQNITKATNTNNTLNHLIYLNNNSSIQFSQGHDTSTCKTTTTLPQSTSFEMANEFNSNNHLNLLLLEQILRKHNTNNNPNTTSSMDKNSNRLEGAFNEIKLEHVNGLNNSNTKTSNHPSDILSRTLFGRKSMSSALKFPVSCNNAPYIQESKEQSQVYKPDSSNAGSSSQRTAAHRGQRFYTETGIILQQQVNQQSVGQDSVQDLSIGNNNNITKKLFLLEGSSQLSSSRNHHREQNNSKISQNISKRPQSAFGNSSSNNNNKPIKVEIKEQSSSTNPEKQLKNKSILNNSSNINGIFGINTCSSSNAYNNSANTCTDPKQVGNLFKDAEELAALSYSCQALNSSFETANSKMFTTTNASYAKTMTNLNAGNTTVNHIKISSNPLLMLGKNQQKQQQNYSIDTKPTRTNNFFLNYDAFRSLPNYQFQQKQQEQSKNLALAAFAQPFKGQKQTEMINIKRPISANKGKVPGGFKESPVTATGKVARFYKEGDAGITQSNASEPVITQGNESSKLQKKKPTNSKSTTSVAFSSGQKLQKHFTVIYKICNKNVLSCGSKDTAKSANNFSAFSLRSNQ